MRIDVLNIAEEKRRKSLSQLDPDEQSLRGQYFTPSMAAQLIAELPRVPEKNLLRILDPGAGTGILTAALVERINRTHPGHQIHVIAVENDETLHPPLRETLAEVGLIEGVTTEIVNEDFLRWALVTNERFDLVIQNPPYAKLQAGSASQKLLRQKGIVVPNIYAAFLSLGMRLLLVGGQQVAITPRSWMNGTYYSTFRRDFVKGMGVNAIHTFESRSKVFGDSGVLQESIIVSATRGEVPSTVLIKTSHDHSDEPSTYEVPYKDVVTPDFIHVPSTADDARAVSWMTTHALSTLADLCLSVSTGRVVDFRSREMLYTDQILGSAPMVYPAHLRGGSIRHPLGLKKPEWFAADPMNADKLLVPGGAYVLIKRFSAKEEQRRVVSCVWSSDTAVAFDNKLNYIHQNGRGLDPAIARGLTVFLNSSQVDRYFRVFSGHTQVNATDLRQMRFPSREQLLELAQITSQDQLVIDTEVELVLADITVKA